MKEIFDLINGMAPYLLLGFFLAGVMHAFVPQTLYRRYLGGHSFRTVLNAALIGIPLPLCSCGVIPTAMSLRKEGASKGATVSFLISTPQTGVDSIIATYSLMGLPFALIRPLVALVTSLLGGCLVNKLDDKESPEVQQGASSVAEDVAQKSFVQRMKSAFRYAFVEMMQDIGRWLLLGLVVAGLITVFVPDSFFALFADKPLLSMLLVLAFAVPMYLCATGSIPIAVTLILKGLSPGTALVLLMAGPAVNVASMLVISKVMGKKTLALYLLSIVSGAIFFGLGIDYLLPREWFATPLAYIHDCHEHGMSWFNFSCLVVLLLLLANAFIQRYRKPQTCGCHGGCACHDEEKVWTVTVKGMSCNHCKANVEKAILKVEGVGRVDINLSDGQTVIYGTFDKDNVRKSVEAIGFEMNEREN